MRQQWAYSASLSIASVSGRVPGRGWPIAEGCGFLWVAGGTNPDPGVVVFHTGQAGEPPGLPRGDGGPDPTASRELIHTQVSTRFRSLGTARRPSSAPRTRSRGRVGAVRGRPGSVVCLAGGLPLPRGRGCAPRRGLPQPHQPCGSPPNVQSTAAGAVYGPVQDVPVAAGWGGRDVARAAGQFGPPSKQEAH